MKTNKYADLVRFGLKHETLMTLKEFEINTLHKNLIEGKKKEPKEVISKTSTTYTYDVTNPTDTKLANDELMKKGVNAELNPATKKMTLTTGEVKEGGKIKLPKKYNPWAICHAQLGPEKTAKFERCVKAVKQSISEGKNPYAFILEEKIVSLLEKHIKPKMKKSELLDLVGKQKMNLPIGKMGVVAKTNEASQPAPSRPAPTTKPGTKTPPKPDKDSPYQPKHIPGPKATQPSKAPSRPAPTTKPGIKTPPKPDKDSPYQPKHIPGPKAKTKMPNWMSFDEIGIKLK